tara:strand:- start:22373 stop:23248 length:876 start_codon:yes stop_codon:yes gene_type:complete
MVASTVILNKGGGGDRVASDLVDDVDTLAVAITKPLETSNRGGTGVPVFVQDQTTGPLDLHFVQFITSLILAVDTIVNSNSITVQSGHGLTTGDAGTHIALFDVASSTFTSAELVSVAGDVLLLDSPMPRIFAVGVATAAAFLKNMNVDGSITPQVFSVSARENISGDIVAIAMEFRDTIPMDFDTFGGLPQLTNGVVLRVNNGDGTYRNLFNFKSNGDIILMAVTHDFTQNNGGGVRGFNAHLTFGGQENHGVVIRLDWTRSEALELVVQDDLTGLTSMDWIGQGSEVQS